LGVDGDICELLEKQVAWVWTGLQNLLNSKTMETIPAENKLRIYKVNCEKNIQW
jgi:hypothetical protein